jgi:hypothetical protein
VVVVVAVAGEGAAVTVQQALLLLLPLLLPLLPLLPLVAMVVVVVVGSELALLVLTLSPLGAGAHLFCLPSKVRVRSIHPQCTDVCSFYCQKKNMHGDENGCLELSFLQVSVMLTSGVHPTNLVDKVVTGGLGWHLYFSTANWTCAAAPERGRRFGLSYTVQPG